MITMKKLPYVLLGIAVLFLVVYLMVLHKTESKYELIWEDHFNGTMFDDSSWSKIPRGTSPWNKFMSDADCLYDVKDGNLVLKGLENKDICPDDTAAYITGGLYTRGKVSLGYGKVEVKAKLQGAKGAWPAIWMLPENKSWPDGGEIDIMERLNHDSIAYQTVHSNYTYNLKILDPPHGSTGSINPDDYNVYAVEILPDSLHFSINDKRTFSYPRIETDKEGQYPFGAPFYLLIDMQIGGDWVGPVDPSQYPVEMLVDWVKFYKLKD